MAPTNCDSLPAKSKMRSEILYQNSNQDIYLIDIPSSIALAQGFADSEHATGQLNIPSLLSCAPLEYPYPGPSTEPKSAKAMLKIMERIPPAELEYRQQIAALVSDALRELRVEHTRDWCLPRAIEPSHSRKSIGKSQRQTQPVSDSTSVSIPEEPSAFSEPVLSFDAAEGRRDGTSTWENEPPLILAPGLNIVFTIFSVSEMAVKNTSSVSAMLQIKNMPSIKGDEAAENTNGKANNGSILFRVPPKAAFTLTSMSSQPVSFPNLRPYLPSGKRFDFIIMDPPWPNRSVHRSEHYRTSPSFSGLQALIGGILKEHLDPTAGIAAIWTTNSAKSRSAARGALQKAGLQPFEEWVWIKTTTKGQPVTTLRGLWRQPFEVLVLGKLGKQNDTIRRRIIAAVPDIHSRKPNLKELVEQIFFPSGDATDGQSGVRAYEALEVFARNLTAGWWACGDEVLRFNWDGWWTSPVPSENLAGEDGLS